MSLTIVTTLRDCKLLENTSKSGYRRGVTSVCLAIERFMSGVYYKQQQKGAGRPKILSWRYKSKDFKPLFTDKFSITLRHFVLIFIVVLRVNISQRISKFFSQTEIPEHIEITKENNVLIQIDIPQSENERERACK